MIRYLWDSNTCIEYLRRGMSSPVGQRLAKEGPGVIAITSVVLSELLFGAEQSADPIQSHEKVAKFRSGISCLPYDEASASEYAKIRLDLKRRGLPIGPYDMMIAAGALSNDLILVTHNTSEFGRIANLSIEDWQIETVHV